MKKVDENAFSYNKEDTIQFFQKKRGDSLCRHYLFFSFLKNKLSNQRDV